MHSMVLYVFRALEARKASRSIFSSPSDPTTKSPRPHEPRCLMLRTAKPLTPTVCISGFSQLHMWPRPKPWRGMSHYTSAPEAKVEPESERRPLHLTALPTNPITPSPLDICDHDKQKEAVAEPRHSMAVEAEVDPKPEVPLVASSSRCPFLVLSRLQLSATTPSSSSDTATTHSRAPDLYGFYSSVQFLFFIFFVFFLL